MCIRDSLAVDSFYAKSGGKDPSETELSDLVFEAIAEIETDPPGRFNATEFEFRERRDITPEQAAHASIPFDQISERRRSQMVQVARRGTKYPGGAVPQAVMEQAYAAFVLQDTARFRTLLMGVKK